LKPTESCCLGEDSCTLAFKAWAKFSYVPGNAEFKAWLTPQHIMEIPSVSELQLGLMIRRSPDDSFISDQSENWLNQIFSVILKNKTVMNAPLSI
jgi:hypothetical protein